MNDRKTLHMLRHGRDFPAQFLDAAETRALELADGSAAEKKLGSDIAAALADARPPAAAKSRAPNDEAAVEA
ncbi:hypothetical protein [Novosphingopyxis sp. YJ-S2-01]|uniref:hypothetical protein n=1 Tax=Novosphingopyxis sp. YJ-S2-01 TaxID=2794021 RepID=UPI0018DC7213|nr:hypothetical protein [Novosphingopyxis sp. YJ-S2-01]MBH9537891.1 hypothetical protein [Novosphingopyxis sp. YJ-S2-01]